MQPIGQILNSTPLHSSHSPCEKITASQAKALGIKFDARGLDEYIICEFCGAELPLEGLYIAFLNECVTPKKHRRCSCEQATMFRAKLDSDLEAEKIREETAEKARKAQDKIDRLLLNSGLGARFQGRTFETFRETEQNANALRIALRYVEKYDEMHGKGKGLFFSGPCGTGKTHLAAAISISLIQKSIPVVFTTLIDLLAKIRATFRDDSRYSEDEITEAYRSVSLLILDDLGKESPTDWTLSTLYSIINDRYERKLPLVVTTNYTDEQLINALSRRSGDDVTAEAIVSRLHEMTYGVPMQGIDMRREGGMR